MNSPAAPRVPLTCRLVRLSAAFTAAPAPGGWSSRHLAACPDCRQHVASLVELDRQLTRQAHATAPELPPGFEERVFAAVRSAAVRPPRRRSASTGWIALGAAGALAALALTVAQFGPWSRPAAPALAAANPPASDGAPTAGDPFAVAAPGSDWWAAVAPRVTTLTGENPLQREIDAVQADTRSALQFLARNFLPSDIASDLAADPSPSSS